MLIAGATHTPYAHAVFGFDVFIPDEFPDVPPEMHFHSYGVRLNPNLSHKVRLSRLWGRGLGLGPWVQEPGARGWQQSAIGQTIQGEGSSYLY